MAGIKDYSTNPNSNDGLGLFDENQAPSTVNNGGRQVMADTRSWYETSEYRDLGNTPTYVSATTFTLTGDQTATYSINRAIKCTDSSTLYGFITNSVYTSVTTVTVALISGSLSASLSAVALGLDPTYSGLPYDQVGQIKNKFTASGTNTYTGTLSNIVAYEEGLEVVVVFTNYNTDDDCTLNLNSLGAKSIYVRSDQGTVGYTGNGQDTIGQLYKLHSGAIRSSVAYKMIYTNGHWLMLHPSRESASAAYDGTSIFNCGADIDSGIVGTTSTVYIKYGEITLTKDHIQFSGSLNINVGLQSDGAVTAYGKIYRNGGAVGTEQTTTSALWQNFTETITGWSIGDTLEIWAKTSSGAVAIYAGVCTAYNSTDGTAVKAKGFHAAATTVTTP